MLFSDVLGSMTRAGDAWTVSVPADWLQGRSVFGGLQAALALQHEGLDILRVQAVIVPIEVTQELPEIALAIPPHLHGFRRLRLLSGSHLSLRPPQLHDLAP